MHSMQAGYLEKAQKYTDKALMQLEKLKSRFVHIQSPVGSLSMTQCPIHSDLSVHSAGQQSHPVHIPSHPAGTYHHVPARHWTQGHSFARGEVSCDGKLFV